VALQTAGGITIATMDLGSQATATLLARVPTAGTYFVYVNGGPAEYTVSVKLN
jgi:hypothetical protein